MQNSGVSLQDQIVAVTKKIPLQVVVFGQTLLIVVLILIIPVIFLSIKNSKSNNLQASIPNGTATISLSPASTQLVPNTHQNVDVLINTSQEHVDGIQTIVLFTGTIPSDLSFSPNIIPGLTAIVNTTEPTSNGKKISVAFITSNPQQPFTTNSALTKIGTFSFTVPPTGTMNVAFNQQSTSVIQSVTSKDILRPPLDSAYTFAFAQNQSEPSLSFDTLTPPNPQQVGSNFQVNVVADTAGQKVSGVDAQLTFDPNTVEIVSIQQGTGASFPSYQELTYDNTAGKIYISANIGTSASPTPVMGSNIQVAKIIGKTKTATSSTSLQFVFAPNDRNDSNLVLFLDQQGQEPTDILAKVTNQELIAVNAQPSPGPTATPSPEPTLAPSATPLPTSTPISPVNTTMQFLLQGKNRPEIDKTAQIEVDAKSVDNTQTVTSTLTTDTTGQAQIELVPNNYVILVKAPGYLAKKIGSTTSPIQVTGGATPLNLTSTPLLGGDFNGDGEVNEIDYTLKFLTSFRDANPVVDLDSSGVVNNLDFAIMRSNWALHSDTL
ncbi:MAG: cohesin domain-containing protein [Patescibacteria group bacterium]